MLHEKSASFLWVLGKETFRNGSLTHYETAGLAPFTGTYNSLFFHHIYKPGGTGIADTELSLEHGTGCLVGRNNKTQGIFK